jgi:hypothetical protein
MTSRAIAICSLLVFLVSAGALAKERQFTDQFPIAECTFQTTGGNPYFILQPLRELHYSNASCVAEGECSELEELVITVLDETRGITLPIDGVSTTVTTRIVEERETADGHLVEISRNFFAECAGTGDVYYFGEEVDIYTNDVITSHEGAWLAGANGAQPGIVMPGGAFLLGSRYFQEVAPGVALDRAEHVAMGLELSVPAGDLDRCVEVEETTPLEKKSVSQKFYCSGVGLVIDGDLELVSVVGSGLNR